MPAFLVELKDNEKMTLQKDMKLGKQIVWAENAAQARAVAAAYVEGDSNTAWANADVTDLSVAQDFAHMVFGMRIEPMSPDPDIDIEQFMPAGKVLSAVSAIETAGTGYQVNNVLTVAGGTAVRPATVRVKTVGGGGEITSVAVVDPGDAYTVDPTVAGNAVTGGNGSGAELDLVLVSDHYLNHIGKMVTNLNAQNDIAGAAVDLDSGASGLLTIASGGGGDDLGDKTVTAKFFNEADGAKLAIPGLLGTVTHEGNANAALSVALVSNPIAGNVIAAM